MRTKSNVVPCDEELYQLLYDNANDAIFLMKGNEFVDCNPKTLEMFDCTREQIIGNTPFHFSPKQQPDGRESCDKGMDKIKLALNHVPQFFEWVHTKYDGTLFYAEVSLNAVEINEEQYIQAIVRDITSRKKAEMEKAALESQLRHSQKMEAVGQLAGGIAHDFNNILTIIICNIESIIKDISANNPILENLNEINKAADRAASLTRQLLAFSRCQPLEQCVLNLNSIISNLEKMLKRIIGEDIELRTKFDDHLLPVSADLGQMEQVIMNLAVNSRDAMPNGGMLTLKTENIMIDQTFCYYNPEIRPGRFVCLTVSDTGCGIDQSIMKKIFEPFFTTKGTEGTGLGLAVVYGILKQHNGWIDVSSEPDKGAQFKIYLPATIKDEPVENNKDSISTHGFTGSGEKILIVEDEPDVLSIASRALQRNGYRVFEATNAEDAIEIFADHKGTFHLLFSDVVLPNKSGIQLVEHIHEQNPRCKIVLSSGYTDHKSQWRLIHERGFRYLQKPYLVSELLKMINETIHSE